MAYLLHFYEKMRLIREINQIHLNLLNVTRTLDRATKTISNEQKRFAAQIKNIDSQATLLKSNGKNSIFNMLGIGCNSVDVYNYTGLNAFVANTAQAIFAQGYYYQTGVEADGKPKTAHQKLDAQRFQEMYMEWTKNGGRFVPQTTTDNGQTQDVTERYDKIHRNADFTDNFGENTVRMYVGGYNEFEVNAFLQAVQKAQQGEAMNKNKANELSTLYDNNVDTWAEAEKARIEQQEDEVLEPLSFDQTMLEMEKEQLELKLEELKERKKASDDQVKEGVKDMVPKFGK